MPTAHLSLQADKRHVYFHSLCKHFARKVEVVRDGDVATVAFPMGSCEMSVRGEQLAFRVHADDESSLECVKSIIASHVTRFKAFRQVAISWRAGQVTESGQP